MMPEMLTRTAGSWQLYGSKFPIKGVHSSKTLTTKTVQMIAQDD